MPINNSATSTSAGCQMPGGRRAAWAWSDRGQHASVCQLARARMWRDTADSERRAAGAARER